MFFQSWLARFKQKIWVRTIARVLKEVWIPAVVAFCWTGYSWRLKPSWNWAEVVQQFGGTFFVLGYFANYFARSLKLVKDDDRHIDLITQQKQILTQMEGTARLVASYATGGNGFAAVWFASVQEYEPGKKHIYELTYSVEGEYPLYDVRVRYFNLDDPVTCAEFVRGHTGGRFGYVHLGDIVPGFAYPIQTSIPIVDGRPNRILVNWQARNGTWYQRLELRLVGDDWQMATFVKRGDKELMVKAATSYELDEEGRPKFDLSQTAMDVATSKG